MDTKRSFTITTPLYYVNDKPHLGSTYTTIASDAIARYQRLLNYEVFFLTGVDEHGQKIQRTAELNKIKPKQHCDQISEKYRTEWKNWDITYDNYVRTTSEKHLKFVEYFFSKVMNSGDIRIGRQTGWYCVGCEEYKDLPEDSIKPICNIHQKELEWRDEENLFFCLSKYQEQIEKLVQSDSFIRPISRRNEIISFVSGGLKDFSISRVNVEWGIPVPGYKGHTFYVWFDALLGYLSGLDNNESIINYDMHIGNKWPADIQIIGKDILRFHAVYWPAMLISAGYPLPKQVFGHGFLTREGQKMGKSLGNVLDPDYLLKRYGRDATRWYLLRDIEFGQDGDFQTRRFVDIVNNDLSNTIGNLLNRTSSMSRKWFNNKTPSMNKGNELYISSLKIFSETNILKYHSNFKECNFKKASEIILQIAINANVYLNEQEPWKKIKEKSNFAEVSQIIYDVLETARLIGCMLKPITPDLSERILDQLGYNSQITNFYNELIWGKLPYEKDLPESLPVMERIDFTE